jgi:hypothetical protein
MMKTTKIKEKAAAAGVCSWCRSEYDRETGVRIRQLTDEEYSDFSNDPASSHGMCGLCKEKCEALTRAAEEDLLERAVSTHLILAGGELGHGTSRQARFTGPTNGRIARSVFQVNGDND